MLILGWNDRAGLIVTELDQYVAPGSHLLVAAEFGEIEVPETANLRSEVRHAPTTDRATLEALDVTRFDQIIVLCYSDHLDAQRADARTLVTLLHLREMLAHVPHEQRPGIVSEMLAHVPHEQRPGIVSEMLDDRNRELAQVTEVDDVIVSDKILSLVIAQISENARLDAVFGDLLDADGAELYLRPVEEYRGGRWRGQLRDARRGGGGPRSATAPRRRPRSRRAATACGSTRPRPTCSRPRRATASWCSPTTDMEVGLSRGVGFRRR